MSHINEVLNRKEHASLPLAVKIEKATQGKYKVEDLVRPEVAEALREYLKLRCPTSKTSTPEEQLKSLKDKEG